jgi:thiosulfate/3-mercaptopyruvate sulfurtransferase
MPSTLSARNSSARGPNASAAHPLLVDDGVNPRAQPRLGDPDEPPRLHQPDARGGMRGAQQPAQHVLGHQRIRHALSGTIDSMSRDDVLITATELAQRLDADEPLTILDVRWQLTEPDGRASYERGHLPGAVYVSLEDEFSDHSVSGRGRHPLPSGRSVEAAARRWGVRNGVPVVVYDDWNRAGSARAWWVLTAAGLPDVRILDGGLSAWAGPLEIGSVTPEPGDVRVAHDDLYAGARPTLTAEQAADADILLDARAPERFRGDVEPVDPVAGHIPGAQNMPSTGLLSDDGRFLSDGALFDRIGDIDGPATGVYCGSGVTASVVLAALAAAGVDAALYPGSWSEWCSDSTRPVARGSDRPTALG